MFGLSSMNSGASEILPMIRASLFHWSWLFRPLRRSWSWMVASADRMRMVISVRLISSENTAVAMLCLIAAARAMSMPRVDLPTAGRAAMTIIWPGCRPLVQLVELDEAGRHADHLVGAPGGGLDLRPSSR